jgi:hypothetical protein
VISPNHYRFLARTSGDMWPSSYCRFQPQPSSDVDIHCRFWPTPNHFLILKPRTSNEGSSLPVGRNPALMRPVVMFGSVVVNKTVSEDVLNNVSESFSLWFETINQFLRISWTMDHKSVHCFHPRLFHVIIPSMWHIVILWLNNDNLANPLNAWLQYLITALFHTILSTCNH